MFLEINNSDFLPPLHTTAGNIERKLTTPILSNVLLKVLDGILTVTTTDNETEWLAHIDLKGKHTEGATTVPARKLIDICRNLPDDSKIALKLDKTRLTICAGRSRFSLNTLPADKFPSFKYGPGDIEWNAKQQDLRYLLENTYFSISQNDVRYYLNGLLLHFNREQLTTVAADGHRLALAQLPLSQPYPEKQFILPRKAASEMLRVLNTPDARADLTISDKIFTLQTTGYSFSSKLIDTSYPNYSQVIPRNCKNKLTVDRDAFKGALTRVAVLSNEKSRGVGLQMSEQTFRVLTHNPDQEEAEEVVDAEYQGEFLEVGFNVGYLLDALNHLPPGPIQCSIQDARGSLVIRSEEDLCRQYIIMPLRF